MRGAPLLVGVTPLFASAPPLFKNKSSPTAGVAPLGAGDAPLVAKISPHLAGNQCFALKKSIYPSRTAYAATVPERSKTARCSLATFWE